MNSHSSLSDWQSRQDAGGRRQVPTGFDARRRPLATTDGGDPAEPTAASHPQKRYVLIGSSSNSKSAARTTSLKCRRNA